MLLQADLKTFWLNLFLILCAVVLLTILFFVVISTITLIRAGLWVRRRRKAEALWLKASRRADGRTYPAGSSGVCDSCHRGSRHIYSEYGKNLCPACYEGHWRRVENWTGLDDSPEFLAKPPGLFRGLIPRARRQKSESSST